MSAAIGRVSTSKDTAGCESSAVSSSELSEAWEASKYCVLEEAGSDTSDNNKTQNWLQAVGVSVIAMYHLAYFAKFNSSRDVTGVLCFCHTHKMWFPWMIQRKNPYLIGAGSCKIQPSFWSGSVSLVSKGEGGPSCRFFFVKHFQMLRPTPPYTFWPIPEYLNYYSAVHL